MINVIGQFFGSSGYAMHTRSLVNALNKQTEVKLITNLIQGFERMVNDEELKMIKRIQDYDTNLIITHPIHWRSHLDAKHNWVYLIWEGDKITKWMLDECMNPEIEKIIVPSTHTHQAILKAIYEAPTIFGSMIPKGLNHHLSDTITPKIVVIPHGVDLDKFYPVIDKKDKGDGSNVSLSGDTKHKQGQKTKVEHMPVDATHLSNSVDNHDDTFIFLANKGLRNLEDRGGVQYLIRAYLEEFTEDENVELILKINPAYGVPNLLQMFPELKEAGPKITFIPEEYTIDQLRELYNQCDVFVSPTRAEAFNLPVAESAACGKMCITTGFGGQVDMIEDKKNGFLIDYKLVPVEHELEYEGCFWAVPDYEHLKKLLRYTFDNREIVKSMGKNALENIRKFSWKSTAEQIYSLK